VCVAPSTLFLRVIIIIISSSYSHFCSYSSMINDLDLTTATVNDERVITKMNC